MTGSAVVTTGVSSAVMNAPSEARTMVQPWCGICVVLFGMTPPGRWRPTRDARLHDHDADGGAISTGARDVSARAASEPGYRPAKTSPGRGPPTSDHAAGRAHRDAAP